jgi:hypothetical protein
LLSPALYFSAILLPRKMGIKGICLKLNIVIFYYNLPFFEYNFQMYLMLLFFVLYGDYEK